jgi:hypothetical protein
MIKVIAQASPTYDMSCFDLRKTLCEEISVMICRYWWSEQDGRNKCRWLSWKVMTKAKEEGDGFRDLHVLNLAMLARQSWRMLQNPDSLCCTVLKDLSFPDASILEAKPNGSRFRLPQTLEKLSASCNQYLPLRYSRKSFQK